MITNGKCNNSHAPSTGLSGMQLPSEPNIPEKKKTDLIWKNINAISMHREQIYQLHIETTTAIEISV